MLRNATLPLIDYDLWWQLACGREMVGNLTLLQSDVFSHTMPGTPWINFEWLSQIILYVIYSIGGLTGLWVAKVCVCLLIIGILTALLQRFHIQGPWLWLLVCAGSLALKSRLYDRVELISLVFFPVLIALLASVKTSPLISPKKIPWIVGALMVVWVNLHGGFLYGIIVIGSFCVGARWMNPKADFIPVFDRSLMMALIAMLINPLGPGVVAVFVEHWVQVMSGPSVIEEWGTPSVQQAPFFWALFVALVLGLVASSVKAPKQTRFWSVAVLLFAVWGTRSLRNTAYSSIVIIFFIADIVQSWPPMKMVLGRERIKRWGWVVALLLLSLFISQEYKKPWNREVVQESRFPFGACQFIQEHDLKGTLYNTYHFGGAIEWVLGKSMPVFMDGRYIFHPLLVDHSRLDNGLLARPDPTQWQQFLGSYGVDIAISEYGPLEHIDSQGQAPFALTSANLMFPRSDWALVYWDDTGMVFLKRVARFKSAIEKLEYRSVWPYNLAQMDVLLNSDKVDREIVSTELQRHSAEVPRSYIRQQIQNMLLVPPSHVE